MKKRLIICLLLVLAIGLTTLVACKKDIDDKYLEELYGNLERTYRGFKTSVTESFDVNGIVTTFDDNNKDVEVKVNWTVTGTDQITVGELDKESGYCRINIPAERPAPISFTLTAKLVKDNDEAYVRADGTEYSITLNLTATAADSLKAAKNGFYDAAIKNPQAGTAYKWAAIAQYQVLYFKGETAVKDYQYQTTTNYSEAADVYLEATEGGYHVYFMNGDVKTYIDIFKYGSNAGSTGFVTNAANLKGVYTVHESGALVGKDPTDSTDTSKGYNLGVREQYIPKISAINYYLDNETGSHGWKTYEHPLFLLDKEYKLPAQENLTADQIIDRANALAEGDEMSGRWTLQGEVIEASGEADFRTATIKVGEKTMIAYGLYTYNNEVKVGAVIAVTGVIKNYNGTVEFDKYCTYKLITAAPEGGDDPEPIPTETTHAGTAADPYTVADAKIVATALNGSTSTTPVYVTGIVSGKISKSSKNDNQYWFDIVTTVGDTDKCILYYVTTAAEPKEGDVMVVKGNIMLFNGNPEIVEKGGIVVSVNGVDTGLDGGETPAPSTTHEGTEADPYTVADARAIALALEGAESNKSVYNDKAVYVKGYVVSISAQNDFYIADTIGGTSTVEFYKGELDEGVTGTIYINDEVVLYGYIANYSKGYKCELAKTNDVTPLVKSITTATSTIKASAENANSTIAFTAPADVEGVVTAQNGTTVTFTVEAGTGYAVQTVKVGKDVLTAANDVYTVILNGNMEIEVAVKEEGSKEQVMTIDLSSSDKSNITTAKAGMQKTPLETTIDGVTYVYCTAYQNDGYLMLASKDNSAARAYFLNASAIPGYITKIVITTGSSASAKAEYRVVMSSDPIEGRQTTGGTVLTGTGELTAVTATVEDEYSYFCITVGNNYNGQIVSIEITYEAYETEAPDAE